MVWRAGGRERYHHRVQIQDVWVWIRYRIEQRGHRVAQGTLRGRQPEDQEHRHRGTSEVAARETALQVMV